MHSFLGILKDYRHINELPLGQETLYELHRYQEPLSDH